MHNHRVLQAAELLHRNTEVLAAAVPDSNPGGVEARAMLDLTTVLMDSGWVNDDITRFRMYLRDALTATSSGVIVDLLLHTYTSLLAWDAAAEGN